MSDLRTELDKIAAKHGRLTPKLVLREARRASHPLHGQFIWDNDDAAERYRVLQARELIASVRVTYTGVEGTQKSVRRYHALRASDEAQFDYLDVEDILRDPMKRKLLLQSMEREWKTMVARFEDFTEFWDLVKGSLRRKKAS